MNLKPLFNVLGALLTLLGITMVVPIFISYFTEGYDLIGFIYSSLICISIGRLFGPIIDVCKDL